MVNQRKMSLLSLSTKKLDLGSKMPKLTARSLSLICLKIHFLVDEPMS